MNGGLRYFVGCVLTTPVTNSIRSCSLFYKKLQAKGGRGEIYPFTLFMHFESLISVIDQLIDILIYQYTAAYEAKSGPIPNSDHTEA